jgi:hypothetical protein
MRKVKPDSVVIDSLALLQDTVQYLRRLPPVPMTKELCERLEAHLKDPEVVSRKRLAVEAEQLAGLRVARQFGPGGQLMAEVEVTPRGLTYRLPGIRTVFANGDAAISHVMTGVSLKFDPR